MSLDYSDIAEERMIDRYGYECDDCRERSHEVRRRRKLVDQPCLCDRCADAQSIQEENTLYGVVDEQYQFGERVKDEQYL